ncbi:MAG: chorismate-binding protein [Bacteroidales bacterium]|jgi:isochorismate synthase|nr:chorismate-binding protein [Bacteroidales bacterium]
MNRTFAEIPLIRRLLLCNTPFAVWRMPGETDVQALIGSLSEVVFPADLQAVVAEQGFVFAPFVDTPESPIVVLRPGIWLKNSREIAAFDASALPCFPEPPAKSETWHTAVEKGRYISAVERAIAEIAGGAFSKVILSRVAVHPFAESVCDAELRAYYNELMFIKLLQLLPNSLVYIVNLPKAGLWLGGTPEALFLQHDARCETVSLAGTQLRQPSGDYLWHTKEIEEQAFVSRYMLDVFYRFGVWPYHTAGPETAETGNVAHLKTTFSFAADKIAEKAGDFIAALHPTPAVCGLPKAEARDFILRSEPSPRRYYTGFLGPCCPDGSIRLYVNLRCMEIVDQHCLLHLGGGITARSVPEKEWNETVAKAQPLYDAIAFAHKMKL